MDIDLELPSSDHERLDIIQSQNDGMNVGQANGQGKYENSLGRDEHHEEMSVPNAKRSSGEDRMDIINVETDIRMGPFEPKNGLEFESKEEAYSFYREYARSVGFGITIKASRRSKKSGKFIDIKIACSRFGSKRESTTTVNPRPCMKTGCNASMHIKKREDGKWFVHGFTREHNHEICPDDFHHAMKGRNKKPDIAISEKKGLLLALDEGDVLLMLEHFMHMQEKNPNFFYAIHFNQEKQLRNVLWVDAKARNDYQNFSDVIFFDTYYLTNGYKVPFVPIVGVNHHFQYILFGGALIGDMATSTFIWLMKTWLKAVGGRAPRVVLTDQELSLKESVSDVFPNAVHLFSLWHILRRVPEKLGRTINQNGGFIETLNKCIYGSWTDKEFEKRWWEMIDKFQIREDEWLQLLFDDRKKWVPTYVKNYFLAGMSTLERSGSVISFYDKYICKETSFKEFNEHSEIFFKDMLELEANADFETRHQEPILKSLSTFEKQMATIYTTTMFKKFQLQILGAASCQVHKQTEDGATVMYQIHDLEEHQVFLVAWNKTEMDICCLCRSFEYQGILCRHAILVLQILGLTSIPHKYILRRWTRSAKIRISESSNRLHYRVQRFNSLCKHAIKLGELGSLSQETYDIASEAFEEVLRQCAFANNSTKSFAETNTLGSVGFVDEEENHGEYMAKSSGKRQMSKKGKAIKQARYKSSEMEVDSGAAALDCFHGSLPGSGQSNTNSPFCVGREDYYSHQAMHNLLMLVHVVKDKLYLPVHVVTDKLCSPKDSLFEGTKCTRGRFEVEDHLQDVVCHWLCVFLNDYISDFGLSFCEDVVLVVIGTA